MLEYNDKTNKRSDCWKNEKWDTKEWQGFQGTGSGEIGQLRGLPACETRLGCSLETIISDELFPGCEVKT